MRSRMLLAGLGVGLLIALSPAVASAQVDTNPDETVKVGHAEEECIHILEKGGSIDDCQEAPNPILPTANELIWGSLAFVVLLGVMWKFALPPVRSMMQAREDRIRNDLERSEQAKTEAEQVLEQYRAQLADARNEAARIIDEARQSADQVRQDLVARAEADAASIRTRAEEDVRLATERAMADLQARVGELSIQLAEKIVERNLDRDTQMALVESYISQVGQN
jgi:F-type H+-transporting ATPase subunit b